MVNRKEKVLERGDHKYTVYYLNHCPHDVMEKNIVLLSKNFVSTNIEPVRIEGKRLEYYGLEIEVPVFETEPAIVVFDSFYGKNFNSCVRIFEKKFKDKLGCKYILGRFNLFSIKDTSQMHQFLEPERGFSVALFEKTEEEILDFAVDFIEISEAQFAFIKGDVFDAKIVKIFRNDELKDKEETFYLQLSSDDISQFKPTHVIEKIPSPVSVHSSAHVIRAGFRKDDNHIIKNTPVPLSKKYEELFTGKGGMIVFSCGNKDPKIDPKKIENTFKTFIPYFIVVRNINDSNVLNEIIPNKSVSEQKPGISYSFANTYGNYYGSADSSLFSPNSITLEVIGLNSEELEKLAVLFYERFSYKRLMVKDYSNNDVYIVR